MDDVDGPDDVDAAVDDHVDAADDDRAAPSAATCTEPILHADMDAFYASVEQRDDPTLAGRPVAVGGEGNRSVVAAASYEARRFGVRSAMPMVRARRLCPDLAVVPARFAVYTEVSRQVMDIFRDVTPLVEPLSLDEAFLDVRGSVRLFGSPTSIAEAIRARVRSELGLVVSVGIGPTKFLAKLGSGKAKPDGIFHLTAAGAPAYLRPLPVGDLWGAGPKTVEKLARYGFSTIGDIADSDQRTLARIVGDGQGRHLHALSQGRDPRRVVVTEPARTISSETTFEVDLDDPVELQRILISLSEKVGHRVRKSGVAGRTVTLKLRFSTFETITRSHTLKMPTDRTHDIQQTILELFTALRLERARVRLLGVGVSNLVDGDAARQLTLDVDGRWEELDKVADRVRARYDGLRVTSAALLDDEMEVRAPTSDDW